MDLVKATSDWFFEANQQPAVPAPDVRQAAFYFGMQCEELAEKLEVLQLGGDSAYLHHLGHVFKSGANDGLFATAMGNPAAAQELLDGDVDLTWVSIGAARAMGSDFGGAYAAVVSVNYKKRWPDGVFHNDPKTNKVVKPAGWTAADLKPYLHPALQQGGWTPPPPAEPTFTIEMGDSNG
jgi:predicted HAD superfamily Cof-like phosphohydrolase